MSRETSLSSELLTDPRQLCSWFREGSKDPSQRRVGTEHEQFLFHKDGMRPVSYEESNGVGRVFAELQALGGFEASIDKGNIVALVQQGGDFDGASITIEPGGQFELSGAPYRDLTKTAAELDRHFEALDGILRKLDLVAVGAGLNGHWGLDDVPWMPKSRYGIMAPYMARTGSMGHQMMKMTCTIQANFDYTSEADAASILYTGYRISPIVSALFATSPLRDGKPSGFASTRCHIWTDTDNDRCGFVPRFLQDADFGFSEYVKWTLDVPMYFVRRDDAYVDFTQERVTFRQYMADGHRGHKATLGDYELHLTTLFPEVRMKRYIEVRGADMGPKSHIVALPVLWKGILYDAAARKAAGALLADLSIAEHGQLFEAMTREGLDAKVPGTGSQLRELAVELVRLARAGLKALAAEGMADPSEGDYLAPLDAIVVGDAPHQRLLKRYHELGGDTEAWLREQVILGA